MAALAAMRGHAPRSGTGGGGGASPWWRRRRPFIYDAGERAALPNGSARRAHSLPVLQERLDRKSGKRNRINA